MSHSKALSLFLVVAAFAPLYSAKAQAAGGYAGFTLPPSQSRSMESPTYRRCMDRTEGVTAYIDDCLSAEAERLDRRLNVSYQAALRRLPPARARALRLEERAWLVTRYDRCEAAEGVDSQQMGSLERMSIRFCGLEELKRRIIWIERWR